MTFQKAIEKFDRLNDRGRIPNRKDGGTHSIKAGRRDVIVSAARRALHRATDVADVSEVDIRPYAETLPEHAFRYADEQGLSKPVRYRSRVRLFLLVVEGHEYTNQRHGASRVLPGWKDLYEALERVMERDGHDAGLRSSLLRLQYMANVRGIQSPEHLPDRRTLDAWGEEDGISTRYMRRAYRAYRLACGEMGAEHLPDVDVLARSSERGVRSLDNLPALLADAGCARNPYSLQSHEIVQAIAPRLRKAAEMHLEECEGVSGAYETTVWGATSRVLAAAIRLDFDPAAFSFFAAFRSTVEVESKPNSLLEECLPEATTVTVSPMDLIVEQWAQASWENSPLQLENGKDFAYTDTVEQDLRVAFKILNTAYGEDLRKRDPDTWRSLAGEYRRLSQRIDDHNSKCFVTGRKDKARLLDAITWPQLVCVGLPALRRKVYALRGRYFTQYDRHGDLRARPVHDARTRFHNWLSRYLVTAVIADDGLRIKNYTGAVVGENVFPTVDQVETEESAVTWDRIRRVETKFRGGGPESSSLKSKRDENDGERRRERFLLPGIVDHDLLLDYFRDARPYALFKAGLIPSEDDFDLQHEGEGFAFFVSPASERENGRYNKDSLSTKVGKTLHWICRHVLDRDVPDWDDKERTTTWRELFAPHIIRLMIGTYWGGLRNDWAYAMRLTNDKRDTLQDAYDEAASGAMQKKMVLSGWEHPHHFDDILDRIRQGETVDWDEIRRNTGLP